MGLNILGRKTCLPAGYADMMIKSNFILIYSTYVIFCKFTDFNMIINDKH